jgi:acid phosphatase (class A)
MRRILALLFGAILCPLSAQAALLDPALVDASRLLPPPPAPRTARANKELAEVKSLVAHRTAAMKAAAARDAEDETADIFNVALGFDLATFPLSTRLLQLVIMEEDADTKPAKSFFRRDRPWIVDPSIKTCTPIKPGPAANSYPSGHATFAFSMGVVLASLVPEKSQAILRRAGEYAENRVVCGVHFRSDIIAGQQYGTVLALRLMENPEFKALMDASRAELRGRP